MTQAFSTLRAANAARQAEWDPSDKITLAYRGNEMGGECGEAQDVIKKLERERLGIPGSRATIDQLAEELADVVICADLIAMGEGIDLDPAVAHKFNQTSANVGLETRLAPADELPVPQGIADRLAAGHRFNAYGLPGGGFMVALGPIDNFTSIAHADTAWRADLVVAALRIATGQPAALATAESMGDEE